MAKRRILSILLSVMMVLSLIPNYAFAQSDAATLTITAESKEVLLGSSTVDVVINVENNPGIASLKVKIGYDSNAMTLKNVTVGDVFAEDNVTDGDLSKNPYTFLAYKLKLNQNNGNLITLTFDINENCSAGEYAITLSEDEVRNLDDTDNLVPCELVNGCVKVTAQKIEGVSFDDEEVTYNGAEQQIVVSGELPENATVEYKNNTGKDVGEYNATAIVTAPGYEMLELDATLTINPKAITVSGLKAENKTYDGTTEAKITGGELNGVEGTDNIELSMPAFGTFAKADVGTGIVVDVETKEISISGDSAKNYELDLSDLPVIKANITKAPLAVKADDLTIVKGSKVPELTYKITDGKLFGDDTLTGALATKADGTKLGSFDITQGTLKATSNYNFAFTKGTLTVVDKNIQTVVVRGIENKTYGDEAFKIGVEFDPDSEITEVEFASSNEKVVTVDEEGLVTVVGAGSTKITVTVPGNDEYAPFEKDFPIVVAKREIIVTANNGSKKIGSDDPEFTYTYEGELVDGDEFVGKLERVSGEKVGTYKINQGSLAINDNYVINYIEGVFEIVDKTPQTISVPADVRKTYGDEAFKLDVTPDETSKLGEFTYEINNTDVAEVEADGTVTIKAAGEAEITVKQAGNEDYAPAEAKVQLVVGKKAVEVSEIDLDNKTAVIDGILESDETAVELDFDSIKTTVTSYEKNNTEVTSTLKVENFKLTGDKAKADNYFVSTSELVTSVVSEIVQTSVDENVSVEIAKAGDTAVIVTKVEVPASPEVTVENIVIDTTVVETKVNTVAIPAETFTELSKPLEITLKGENDTKPSVKLDVPALNSINAQDSDVISISMEKIKVEDLNDDQAAEVNKIKDTNKPVVYTLSVKDKDGNQLASEEAGGFGEGQAIVTIPYEKPSGTLTVKLLKDDGETKLISGAKYDSAKKVVTLPLKHFSEYLIYTKSSGGSFVGGSGTTTSSYVVRFETNDGTAVASQSVSENGVVKEPEAPTKEGYTFEGWYTDKELTTAYDFATKVTKEFTLYAKWIEVTDEWIEVTDEEEKNEETPVVFSDVTEDDWFYENVKFVVENKLMNGVSETEFAPNATLTRAMLVTVLYRNAGEPAVNKSIPFEDVDMGAWYANAVLWAKQNNIVNGITENEFAPDSNITREQIAAIMFRYAQYNGMEAVTLEENLHFTDADEISEYAVSAMNWAVGTGLINGKSATTLNPKDNATRAEIAAILQRFIEANK